MNRNINKYKFLFTKGNFHEFYTGDIFLANYIEDDKWLLGIDYLECGQTQIVDIVNDIYTLSEFFNINYLEFREILDDIGGYSTKDYCYINENLFDKFIEAFEPYLIMKRLVE